MQVITRSIFGALKLAILGGLAVAALLFAAAYSPDPTLTPLIDIVALVAALITLVAVWVYYLSKIELSDSGIKYIEFASLFSSQTPEVDWNSVQSIDVKRPTVFAQLFGYGTLFIQTADADPNLSLTYVARVAYWRKFIDDRANLEGSDKATV